MILLVDNYDSFVYNLYQYMGEINPDILVVRNDEISIEEIERLAPEKIVLSPGPKAPKDAGICVELIRRFYKTIPILGICLGHQAIGEAFGATVSYAKVLYHGKRSTIEHDGSGIFAGIESPTKVARYHSLAILDGTLSDEFTVNARTDDGEIMAISHKEYPVYGLQFHPESVYTSAGKKLIKNFLDLK